MELLRTQLDIQASGVFDNEPEGNDCVKVTTEIFDSTLPSELEFEDSNSPQSNSQNFKDFEGPVLAQINLQPENLPTPQSPSTHSSKENKPSDYHILTKSIVNFTFKKSDQSIILRQTEHAVGSFIPYELKVKTFEVKFIDELSELSKGVPAYKLLWKSMVGYVKTQLYIKNGFIYLLQRKKEGLLVHSIWDLQYLFKLFSDRQQHRLRLIFRMIENNETKLVTKQIQTNDLNLLAHLFQEAKQLEIVSDS